MAYIYGANINNNNYLIEPKLYGTATTNDSGQSYTASLDSGFELVQGVCVQIKFPSTNKDGATLDSKQIYYNNNLITANLLKANHVYNLVYDGVQWQLVGDIDTNTWRPINNTLTSDSTDTSLSAAQGKALKGLIDNKANSDHNHDGDYAAIDHTHSYLSTIGWDKTNKRITQSVNGGTASNVLTFAAGDNITLTADTNKLTIANNYAYSLPLAANGTRGGVQIGYTTDNDNHNYAVQLSSEKMYVNVPWTDTKVTSASNHYTPSRDSSKDKSASATGASAVWNIDVVKGITLETDGKGHVTGIAVTSGKTPVNPIIGIELTNTDWDTLKTEAIYYCPGTHGCTNVPDNFSSGSLRITRIARGFYKQEAFSTGGIWSHRIWSGSTSSWSDWKTYTMPTSGTIALTSDISSAINDLDGDLNNTTPGAGKTLTAFSQTYGKISATFEDISITKSQISDFSHTHKYAGSSSAGGAATNVNITTAAPTASKTVGYITISPTTTGSNALQAQDSLYLYDIVANNNITNVYLNVGKSKIRGGITLHSATNTFHGDLVPETLTVSNKIWTLPDNTGTIALISDIPTNLNELANGPGYVTSSGVTSITLKAGAGISLDTDNTAITSTGTRTISIKDMDTSNGATTKWLNQKGGWSTPTVADIGAAASGHTHDYVPLKTTGGVGSVSGGGNYWYCTIATITTDATYINYPITLEVSGRGIPYTQLQIQFNNSGSVDPGLSYFISNNSDRFYIKKTDTSQWTLYGHFTEKYGNIVVHKISGCGSSRLTTVLTTLSALPEDCTHVSYGGNVATAISSSKATAANITTTSNAIAYYTNTTGTFGSKASANGALYATSANGSLSWGTLPIAQGGTGATTAQAAIKNLFTDSTVTVANGDFTDSTIMITSNNSGSTDNWYRRTGLRIWNYIKSKADSIYAGIDALSVADALVYKGVLAGAATTDSNAYGALTPAANCGDTYKVSTAGFINGLRVEVGDMLICTTDETPAAASTGDNIYTTIRNNWNIIQTSEGSVSTSSTSSTDNAIARWDGTSGRIIQNSNVTINDNGQLYVERAGEIGLDAKNTSKSHQVAFIVGDSGNGGVYDRTNSKWVVYSDPNGNVTLNGNANTTTKANLTTTKNAIAYYTDTAGTFGNGQYVTYLGHAAANAGTNKAGYLDGIVITGTSYGEAANLISNTAGQVSYGDSGPQIRFSASSQNGAILFNHYDSTSGMGVSFNFVTDQGTGAAVKADGLIAKTRAIIGGTSVNNSYVLYSNGATYINGATTINATTTINKMLTLAGTAADTAVLKFSRSDATNGYNYIEIPASNAWLCIGGGHSSADTWYRFTSSEFRPERNNEKDLGSSSIKWKTLYAVNAQIGKVKIVTGTSDAQSRTISVTDTNLILDVPTNQQIIFQQGATTKMRMSGLTFYPETSSGSSLGTSSSKWENVYATTFNGNATTATTAATAAELRTTEVFNIQTGTNTKQHITLETLMNWLINTKKIIPSGVECYRYFTTGWAYASNDYLQFTCNGINYELQLAGCIFEFWGSATAYNAGVFRLGIHSSPTTSFTAATGYTKFPTSSYAEYTCNGSSYSPAWRITTATTTNSKPTLSWDTTSDIGTVNGVTFQVKAMAKPTYSDVGAAPSSTVSCTTANVNSALGTDSSTINQWLNKKGEWSTPTAAQVGAATSGHTHTLSIAEDTGSSSITLGYGNKYKLTAGGKTYVFTMPSLGTSSTSALAGNTTLTNVSYTSASDNAEYPILIKNSTGDTTTAAGVKFDSNITINPNTSTITSSALKTTSTTTFRLITSANNGTQTNQVASRQSALWNFDLSLSATSFTTGDTIIIKTPGGGGSNGVFLSLDNGATYRPICMTGTGRLTTHFTSGVTLILTYDSAGQANSMYGTVDANGVLSTTTTTNNVVGGCWRILNGYDSGNTNDTAIMNIRIGSATYKTTTKYQRYVLSLIKNDTHIIPLNTDKDSSNNNGTTANSHTLTTDTFDITSYIFVYNTNNASYAADAAVSSGGLWYGYSGIDMRYSFNITTSTFTAHKNVYIKASLQSATTAKLCTEGNPVTQTLPSTKDNYIYILIGRAYNGYCITLFDQHPIYYYDGTAIREFSPINTIGAAKGDLMYWSAANIPTRLALGTAGYFLQSAADGPTWAQTLGVANGGTGNTTGTATYITTTADTSNSLYLTGVTSSATSTLKHNTNLTINNTTLAANGALYLKTAASNSLIFQRGDTYVGAFNTSNNLVLGIGDATTWNTVTGSKLYVNGRTLLNNSTASSTAGLSSQLIVRNNASSPGNVAIELVRGSEVNTTYTSWQIAIEGGDLHFRDNYKIDGSALETTYTMDAMSIVRNTNLVTIGNNKTGSLWVGTATASTAGTGERDLGIKNGSGRLYLYAAAATNGNKGLYSYATNQSTGGAILTVNQSNQISAIATLACSPTITGTLNLTNTNAGQIKMTRSAGPCWIWSNANVIAFCANYSTEIDSSKSALRINTDTVDGYTNNYAHLGSSSVQWKDVHSYKYMVEEKVTLQWNSTDSSLDFVFA